MAAASVLAATVTLAGCGAPGLPGAPSLLDSPGAAVTQDQSSRIMERVMAADTDVREGKPEAISHLNAIYAGEGARAVKANQTLTASKAKSLPKGAPSDVKVLATSRGTDYPRYLLGASLPPGNKQPLLHMIVGTDVRTPYRIAMSAQMLPTAHINAFYAANEGSPVVTDGSDMNVKPVDLLKAYADGLSDKAPENPPYDPDTFSEQIHKKAKEFDQDYEAITTVARSNQVMADPMVAMRQLNGDTMVMGAIERTEIYTIKPGKQMKTPGLVAPFLPGRAILVQKAQVQVMQFLVFILPKDGKAKLVAATEQVVGASGF
ncbi:hypothetical protein [Austwickia sp. TVS 96-490-7B]|uniref:hypothetical protein n=1 Tax=Austwickia sp. TVS 96-490-7B TaxID=2830843 RepID=UPI001C55B210|nr:hypothetical protein [Austwickia sp. TVS 96-490-7B]